MRVKGKKTLKRNKIRYCFCCDSPKKKITKEEFLVFTNNFSTHNFADRNFLCRQRLELDKTAYSRNNARCEPIPYVLSVLVKAFVWVHCKALKCNNFMNSGGVYQIII